jgi:hypothetical protein
MKVAYHATLGVRAGLQEPDREPSRGTKEGDTRRKVRGVDVGSHHNTGCIHSPLGTWCSTSRRMSRI